MTDRDEYIAGLRQLADLLEQHPELPLPYEGNRGSITFHFLTGPDPKAAMVAAARVIPGTLEKHVGLGDYFDLRGSLHGLDIELTAYRKDVCERIVTGTRQVTVEEPDPDALAEVPTVKVTKTEEIVEWVCSPLLAGDGPPRSPAQGTPHTHRQQA